MYIGFCGPLIFRQTSIAIEAVGPTVGQLDLQLIYTFFKATGKVHRPGTGPQSSQILSIDPYPWNIGFYLEEGKYAGAYLERPEELNLILPSIVILLCITDILEIMIRNKNMPRKSAESAL